MLDRSKFDEISSRIKNYPDNLKLNEISENLKRKDLDKFSIALLSELQGKINLKINQPSAEFFEKAGYILEDYWVANHLKDSIKKSSQIKILRRALKNYSIAKIIYSSNGLKISESRVQKRIVDLNNQIKSYSNSLKKFSSILIILSFIFSMSLFSSGITGFSIANVDNGQSFLLGGFFLFMGLIGAAYIIFFNSIYSKLVCFK